MRKQHVRNSKRRPLSSSKPYTRLKLQGWADSVLNCSHREPLYLEKAQTQTHRHRQTQAHTDTDAVADIAGGRTRSMPLRKATPLDQPGIVRLKRRRTLTNSILCLKQYKHRHFRRAYQIDAIEEGNAFGPARHSHEAVRQHPICPPQLRIHCKCTPAVITLLNNNNKFQ